MKKTILVFLMGLSVASHGATALVSNINFAGPGDVLYADSTGALLDGGIVSLGYFAAAYDVSAGLGSPTTLAADFTSIADGFSGAFTANLGGSILGYADTPSSGIGTITGANPLISRPLYLFVGNMATLVNSTEFLLFDLGFNIGDDNPFVQEYVGNPIGITPLIGSLEAINGDPVGFGSGTYTLAKTEAVPEPSALLLSVFGALALLRRKR